MHGALAITAALLSVIAGSSVVNYYNGYNSAAAACKEKQAAADRRDYGEIIARMAREGVDLNSADAVYNFLSELAGEPVDAQ